MTRVSWNEIRVRAAGFAREWRGASYEKGQAQTFYNEFFEVFGVRRRSVARFEEHVKKLDNSSGYIDLFWPGVLLVEQKSAGRNLADAYDQAGEYFDALAEWEKPGYIVVSDFQRFELYDLAERRVVTFGLSDLSSHVEEFGFIRGQRRRVLDEQDPVNVRASALMGKIHDTLSGSGYTGHDLERLLVRVAFCLFADDTGVFDPRDVFFELLDTRTSVDGSDLGQWLASLFEVLNTPEKDRSALLDEDLNRFPYINGDLFGERLRIPSFNAQTREQLLEACRFDWSSISPAIFGALFQSVMNPAERRAQGAHYTTEENILKVIRPLFLDDLWTEFERIRKRRDTHRTGLLQRFQRKLGAMRFFDPACGCGNFLVVAYRELRFLELETIREIRQATKRVGQRVLDVELLSEVNVDQFFGIEIGEFAARIAETALWMTDQLMNTQLGLEFGEIYTRIPLETSPRIFHGDALETDWAEVLPPEDCTVVFGNPPFVGSKFQSEQRRVQLRSVAKMAGRTAGTLDYVTAWFIKAADYIQQHRDVRIGFVATNSITQGEQVAQLWPILFDRYELDISFAHRTFPWGSDAEGKAHVHVVIAGLDHRSRASNRKRLFDYPKPDSDPVETVTTAISPYFLDGKGMSNPHLTVRSVSKPINGMKRLKIGSKPIDGGHYIFKTAEQRNAFLTAEPAAEPFLHPYIGSWELINGLDRWILALHDVPPDQLARLPRVREQIAKVRKVREASKSAPTQKLAETPTLYHVNVIPTGPFLAIPKVSSERREYIPIALLEPPTIPSDLLFVLTDATLADFALLTSKMHMTWTRLVGGRLESRYRYSIGVVYNTFPVPPEYHTPETQSMLESLAQAVLDIRGRYPQSTLAHLYDPDLTPPDLRKAHQQLDRAVDRLYHPRGYKTEPHRLRHLLDLYEETLHSR